MPELAQKNNVRESVCVSLTLKHKTTLSLFLLVRVQCVCACGESVWNTHSVEVCWSRRGMRRLQIT